MTRSIAYVVIREDLWGPVVRSQVLEVLESVDPSLRRKIVLVWLVRLDVFLRSRAQIRSTRAVLRRKGLHLVALPFVAWRFPVAWFLLPLVVPQWLVGLLWMHIRHGCRVFHCRSYHAGLAGILLKKILGIRVVFDPRSPFPEENVAAGRWNRRRHRVDFFLWKKIEKLIAQQSDSVIATSWPFADFFKNYVRTEKVWVIPNNYIGLQPDSGAVSEDSNFTICYAGSFGHWNNPKTYLRFMSLLSAKDEHLKYKFIVSPATCDNFSPELVSFPFLKDRVDVCSVAQKTVLQELSGGLVGVQIMEHPDARLGIKVVEYLAAGLPVIVSGYVRGAADIVRKYDVGIVVDEMYRNIDEVVEFIHQVAANRLHWRRRCQKVARELFSTEAVAEKLFQLYDTLA